MLDLPYAALCWICPTLVTYPTPPYTDNLPTLTTYPTPSSLSICELPLAETPSAPSPNLQVHERFLFRMVPHNQLHDLHTHPTLSTNFTHSNMLSTSQTSSSFTVHHRDELSALKEESHQIRLAIQASITSGKGTEVAYSCHVKNYEDWWVQDQGRHMSEDSQWKEICAHPITAAKVVIFL